MNSSSQPDRDAIAPIEVASLTSLPNLSGQALLEQVAHAVEHVVSDVCKYEFANSTYVVGNHQDFDHVADPLIERLGNRVAGMASFWPEADFNPLKADQLMFRLPHEYIGASTVNNPDLLFVQAFITSSRECRAMISRILELLPVGSIGVAALVMTEQAQSELSAYFENDSVEPLQFWSYELINKRDLNAWNAQSAFYDRFEATLGPTASMMPRRMLADIRGKTLDAPSSPPPASGLDW